MAQHERVFAVNHDDKTMMAIGHESWGGNEAMDLKERIAIYAPNQSAGRDQFYYIVDKFNVQALMKESEAVKLQYKKMPGYWG